MYLRTKMNGPWDLKRIASANLTPLNKVQNTSSLRTCWIGCFSMRLCVYLLFVRICMENAVYLFVLSVSKVAEKKRKHGNV